jgi:hypothetical protein
MTLVHIDVYSHNVVVSQFGYRCKEALLAYCKTLGQLGRVKVGTQYVWRIVKVFVGCTANRSEFHFHINQYSDVIDQLKRFGILESQMQITTHAPKAGMSYKMPLLPKWVAREDQVPVIDYIMEPGITKTVPAQPGFGKTFIALKAASLVGKRTAITVRAQYVKKWVSDIKEQYGYGPKEIMTIQGSKDLKNLIKLARAGALCSRFIIISNKTLHGFIKHYEESNGDRSLYGCTPGKLMALLGIGLLIRDEVHLDFHFNFRTDLYAHVPKTLNLSATLESDDNFINKMFGVMFPHHTRYNKSVYKKYIIATAITYRFATPKRVQCQNFAFKSYSHVLFEQSIMRYTSVLAQYFELIWYITDITYMRERKSGLKLLIYFATTEMCTLAVAFLKTKAGHLTIKRKVEEDPYQNMLTADVVVSTLQSVGTGHDIPGLFKTINTVSINGRQINEQAKGRLRELKGEWTGLVPEYIYLFSPDIPKQAEYHRNKLEQFRETVVAHVERASGKTIRHP